MTKDVRSLYSEAMRLSLRNADQWIDDAKLLISVASFGHASAILRVACEELVKAIFCWYVAEGIYPVDSKTARDIFRTHAIKNQFIFGLLFGIILKEERTYGEKGLAASTDEEIYNALRSTAAAISNMEKVRQKAMYVDLDLENQEVHIPEEISAIEANHCLQVAEYLLDDAKNLEKSPESFKMRMKQIWASVPEETWRTGIISMSDFYDKKNKRFLLPYKTQHDSKSK